MRRFALCVVIIHLVIAAILFFVPPSSGRGGADRHDEAESSDSSRGRTAGVPRRDHRVEPVRGRYGAGEPAGRRAQQPADRKGTVQYSPVQTMGALHKIMSMLPPSPPARPPSGLVPIYSLSHVS